MTPETGGPAEAVGAGCDRRLATLRQAMAGEHVDALVVTHPPNVRYLSGHAGSAGVLVVRASGAHLLVDARYREAARQLVASGAAPSGLGLHKVPGSYDAATLTLLGELGVVAVGIEAEHLSVSRFRWLERTGVARGMAAQWIPVSGLVEGVRLVKDASEQAVLRRAARGLNGVAEAAFRAVRPGAAERDIAGVIEAALRAEGFERPAFDTIVASGPNGALPHYRAGARILQSGDLVVLDFGGVMDGYCSDITRTVAVGPPGTEARRVYGAVLRAQQAAIDAAGPGIGAERVDAAARAVLEQAGLGEAFGHGTGHGLGLEVHELPRVGRPVEGLVGATLGEGMVFTVEPGAYLPGWGGVRIEDDILITAGGCELLTEVPRDLLVL